VILDYWGIVKADIGIRDGRISGIGKAGNPDIQPGVDIVIGPGTEVIAGEGRIITAGGTHPFEFAREIFQYLDLLENDRFLGWFRYFLPQVHPK